MSSANTYVFKWMISRSSSIPHCIVIKMTPSKVGSFKASWMDSLPKGDIEVDLGQWVWHTGGLGEDSCVETALKSDQPFVDAMKSSD
eukprot:9513640-Prorocentrum_lima.AAC.1